jgi:hypothetical protein
MIRLISNRLFRTMEQQYKSNDTKTENGAKSNISTDDVFLDTFFKFVRNIKTVDVFKYLDSIYQVDVIKTIILIFQTRDINEGKGERRIFRLCLAWLLQKHSEKFFMVMPLIKNYGRFDDIVYAFYLKLYSFYEFRNLTKSIDTIVEENENVRNEYRRICEYYYTILSEDLENMKNNKGTSLCAKWFLSEGSKLDRRIRFVKYFCQFNNIKSSRLRKQYLSPLRKYIYLIEHILTNNEMDSLKVDDYKRIPSQAKLKYRNILSKTPEWDYYLNTKKVGVKTLQPDQIIKKYLDKSNEIYGVDKFLEKTWKNKLDELQGRLKLDKTLFVCDTSASMFDGDAIYVSIALGILGSSLSQNELFKNHLMTFSEKPSMIKIPDSRKIGLHETISFLLDRSKFDWGYNTDLYKTFKLLIKKVKNLSEEEIEECMPETIFIISDMQFDEAVESNEHTNFEAIDKLFEDNDLERPRIVFWNVNGRTKDFPIKKNDNNVLLLSGNSPIIMKYLLDNKITEPMMILEEIWKDKRYEPLRQLFTEK